MNQQRLSSGAFAMLLVFLGGSTGCGGDANGIRGAASSSGTGTSGGNGSGSGSGTGSGATSGSTGSSGSGAGGSTTSGSGTSFGNGGSTTSGSTGSSSSGAGGSTTSGSGSSSSGTGSSGGLNPGVAPGLNFDLSRWELQEPVGSAGSPTTILPAALRSGFHDAYFYTDPTDGAMTFWDPENGVTTPNSSYPRSELRELDAAGSGANWAVAGTNTLSATVEVVKVPDHVCIGQIHVGTAIQSGLASTTKPLLELYYHSNGSIVLGIEDSPAGSQTTHPIATVPLGTQFSYVIQLDGHGTITLTIDGTPSTFTMPASFGGYGMYFKAGNYDQSAGKDGTVGAIVKFYALDVSHGP